MLQQAHVVRHAVAALADSAQYVQDAAVRLPGIGLSGNVKPLLESEFCRNLAVHLVNLRGVALKQLHKAGFGAGRSTAAEERQVVNHEVDFLEVGHEILQPQGRPLAHGHRLGRLVVGISEGRDRLRLFGEVAQVLHHAQQALADQLQRVAVDHQVGVVRHIAARGAQVDDSRRARRHLAVGIHVRHHVVADFLLAHADDLVVDIRDMRFQLSHLLRRHRQAQFHLGAGQRDPQLPPGLVPGILGKQRQHLIGRVAGSQRCFVTVCHLLCTSLPVLRIMLSRSGPTEMYTNGRPIAFSTMFT